MASFFEELTKKATGLLTTSGSAGDISGEAAMPSSVGQQAPSMVSNVPIMANVGGQFQPSSVNQVLNPNYQNAGLSPQMNMPRVPQPVGSARSKGAESDLDKLAANPGLFKNVFGMSVGEMKSQWKDKGGFEGLMANPMFSLGLAVMQSAAKGQPLTAELMNNVLAAGQVSDVYAQRIKERGAVLAPISDDQRSVIESVLKQDNYGEPSFWERMMPGNQTAEYREALNQIYEETDKLLKKEAKKGKQVRFSEQYVRQAVKNLERSGKIKKRDPKIFGLVEGTITSKREKISGKAEGGPVKADKTYVVGEKGPEMFVPQVDGNIINNDDAKVVNMLLEANPQLKSVSRARAVKILKNRFPDYF